MSKIIQICILLLSITYSIQSQESCEKTIGCLDKKLSFAADELDKNKDAIQQQQTTIDKLKEELQGYKSKCDAKDTPTTALSTTSSTTTAATTTTAPTTTAATTTAPVQPCPSGWSSFDDFCYNVGSKG